MTLKVPAGAASTAYSIKLADPTGSSVSATFTQTAAATPLLTLGTTTVTPGSSITVQLTQTNLLTANPTKVFVYNVLNMDAMDEVTWTDVTVASNAISFPYTFGAGSYAIRVWYDNYGWGEVSATVSAAALADFTASLTTSSYLGGQLTVTGDYISESAVLTIGAFKGKVISTTPSSAVFEIPALITPTVIATFPSIAASAQVKHSAVISDGGTTAMNTFDGQTATIYTSSNANCYIGVDFGAGKAVQIDRIRFFPTVSWLSVSKYLLGAVFEASADGTTYTEVGSVGSTVHSGWNSFLVSDTASYRYVRMSHTSTSMCKLAEI